MSASKWFISTDAISKPGSPKTAGPFSTLEDALTARVAMENMFGNYSVFEEVATPAVELPTEPTLGWASGETDSGTTRDRLVGYWATGSGDVLLNRTEYTYPEPRGPVHMPADHVTAFTPATAVPTEALDVLRGWVARYKLTGDFRVGKVNDFLAAVDAANGGAA